MRKAVQREQNIYFEMESKEETEYSGVYEDVVGESKTTSATKQMTSEKQKGSSCQSEPMFQRLLCVMATLVVVSFLIATATLISVLLPMISRETSTTSTDCAAGLHEIYRTCAMKSVDDERIKRISHNITSMENTLLKKVQDLTERLESTQDELRSVKSQLDDQIGNNSKTVLEKELQNVWMAINSTAEKTSLLTSKVVNISKTQGPRGPPGYNGTQSPPGVTGGLSLCSYKEIRSPAVSPPNSVNTVKATATETNGKKIIGANCGTNDAKVVTLSSTAAADGKRTYECACRDTLASGAASMYCYLHYWECPS